MQYQQGKDLGLDMHTDNSDVTFNVCLGREFAGAGLTFCGYMGQPSHRHFTYRHSHVKGHCVVHLGRRRHGADDISSCADASRPEQTDTYGSLTLRERTDGGASATEATARARARARSTARGSGF